MYQLPNMTLEVILKEWHPQEYNPPNTDIWEWTLAMESLCDTYGIPDTQRPQCAVNFIKGELRTELEKLLTDSGPIHWTQFTNFMVALDRHLRETWKKLPSELWNNLGITDATPSTPAVVVDTLNTMGLTPRSIATSIGAAIFQTIICGNVVGGLLYLLQSAGTIVAISSAEKIFTATAATRATTTNAESVAENKPPPNSTTRDRRPGDDGDGIPPPCNQTIPQEYILTPQAIQAIIKSWDIPAYDPPLINVTAWLRRVHKLCEAYGVPVTQRVLCAMHHMGADCHRAAHAARCSDLSWDQFRAWLLQWDDTNGENESSNSSTFSSRKWFVDPRNLGRTTKRSTKKGKL